ncbi:hypothetical protein JTB14_024304 [Gonioctena quinquepunctata]|nr:hypothetical protein JTB14_024304 [Gonioctena quinquepunctata]
MSQWVVDQNGLHVNSDEVKVVLELPRLVKFIGSWYRRSIPDFSSFVAPITVPLRKKSKFVWREQCFVSFRRTKKYIVATPILCCSDYTKPFVMQTDASRYDIRAVLTQPFPEGDRVVFHLGKSLLSGSF